MPKKADSMTGGVQLMAEGLQLRHILSMMGVAGFMQWRQFPSRPRCYGTDWERVPGGGRYDISDVSIPNHDGIDCEDS